MALEGGFLFAVVDYLESSIQFGLGISKGPNEYTQHIDLWYSEDAQEKVLSLVILGTENQNCISGGLHDF